MHEMSDPGEKETSNGNPPKVSGEKLPCSTHRSHESHPNWTGERFSQVAGCPIFAMGQVVPTRYNGVAVFVLLRPRFQELLVNKAPVSCLPGILAGLDLGRIGHDRNELSVARNTPAV
jgi:hypothetical protein